MRTKKLDISLALFVLLLAFTLFATGTSQKVFADNVPSPYTATLRYYDDIQITYTLNYPTGGVWSGAGDIPIGGTGNSSQIYCVDPFIHFHAVADTTWDNATSATVDTMAGYTTAAPWTTSAAMQRNNDAVCWLLYNGYRGDYLADDQDSIDSVSRLNTLYSGLVPGVINKQIALMATKVAIWKTLVGDDITILRTSLTSAEQPIFDALVTRLVSDALDFQSSGGGSLGGTGLILDIDDGGFALYASDATFDYYGPITVSADLQNSPGGDISSLLDRVYLNVSGPNTSSVSLVDTSYNPLPTGLLYGTNFTNPYLSNSDFSLSAGEWRSSEFLLAVPSGRQPVGGAHLTIQARAKAAEVPLAAGTPMTFIYTAAGIQDWEYVQAYAGVAQDGIMADLYGETRRDNGNLGMIEVMKSVENATPLDADSQFVFRLYHSDTSILDPSTDLVDLREYVVSSAYSVSADGRTFTLKNGGLAIIDGLPEDGYYWVEEVSMPPEYDTPVIAILNAAGTYLPTSATLSDPFEMDNGFALVHFTNMKNEHMAYLFVNKRALTYVHGNPQLIQNTPYFFTLECSADGGATWAPVNLTGVFKSDNGVILSLTGGSFSLESTDMAFIEIDPSLLYRIIETDPGSNYTSMYLYQHMEPSGSSWTYLENSYASAAWYDAGSSAYVTEAFAVVEGGYYWISVANLQEMMVDLTISKILAGAVTDSDEDQLFSFEVFIMDNDYGIPTHMPVPVSVNASPDTFLIDGIAQDRIVLDTAGNPTIILLKHNETVTIEALPIASYRIQETLDPRFATTYAVGSGGFAPVSAVGETTSFVVEGNTAVVFRNTLRTGTESHGGTTGNGTDSGSEYRGGAIPLTGDDFTQPILAAALFSLGATLLGLYLFRQRKHRLRSNK